MNESLFKKGFLLAGLVNVVGILAVSQGFTNEVLNQADPVVMSNFGLCMIILWGLTYMAVANHFTKLPLICLIFAAEKLAYTYAWAAWMFSDAMPISEIFAADVMTGIFYAGYGLNDAAFMVFFLMAYRFTRQQKHDNQ